MARTLPPLNGLRAFEAAARHLSFKRAAEELHVTPAASSQQVQGLEQFAGVKLFQRLARGLRLTDAGQAALPAVRDGFDLLARGYQRMQAQEESGIVTVSVAPSFGAKWLVPRLDRFYAILSSTSGLRRPTRWRTSRAIRSMWVCVMAGASTMGSCRIVFSMRCLSRCAALVC